MHGQGANGGQAGEVEAFAPEHVVRLQLTGGPGRTGCRPDTARRSTWNTYAIVMGPVTTATTPASLPQMQISYPANSSPTTTVCGAQSLSNKLITLN